MIKYFEKIKDPLLTGLLKLYCDNFRQVRKLGHDEWVVIKGSVALTLFNDQYKRLTGVDVPTIEELPEHEKRKYWEIACRHFTDKDKRIEMSKASYIIDLLTADCEVQS